MPTLIEVLHQYQHAATTDYFSFVDLRRFVQKQYGKQPELNHAISEFVYQLPVKTGEQCVHLLKHDILTEDNLIERHRLSQLQLTLQHNNHWYGDDVLYEYDEIVNAYQIKGIVVPITIKAMVACAIALQPMA